MNTRECLKAFLRERPDDFEHVSTLVLTTATSLGRWKNDMLPKAVNLLALRFFLKMAGYEPDELKNLRPGAYALAEAIVFGGLDIDRVITESGMTPGVPDNVYRILCRGGNAGPKREKVFLALAQSVTDAVSEKRATLQKVLGLPGKMNAPHAVDSPIARAVKAVVNTQGALNVFLSNGATRTDREALRAALKKAGVSIHDLWSTTDMLLTERGLNEKQQLKERFAQ